MAGRVVLSVDSFVRKNERYSCVRGKPYPRIITSTKYKQWIGVVCEEVRRLDLSPIRSGRWRLTVITIWPTARHLDRDVPMGDSDASLSAMKDALQESGLLDDDMRVIEDRTYNLYSNGERKIVAMLEEIERDPAEPMELATELLTHVEESRRGEGYKRRTAEYLVQKSTKKPRTARAAKPSKRAPSSAAKQR